MSAAFEWSPILSTAVLSAVAVAAVALIAIAHVKKARELQWRGFFLLLLALILLAPVFIQEARKPLPDKVIVVVDQSASQRIGGRAEIADKILGTLKEKLKALPQIELQIIITAGANDVVKGESTALFTALQDHLTGIPLSQVAGTIFITDGQVHDVPAPLGVFEKLAPFHVILTGKKDEFDRQITITEAPKYGLLGQDFSIGVKVEDLGSDSKTPVTLQAFQDGELSGTYPVLPGEVENLTFTLKHPGQNVFEFSVPEEAGELTTMNNTAAVIVNGIRDRLKVLLVSGHPHMGERAWRDLLKSDPSIDLVHFTILRSPTSLDMTPNRELALISFPVEELFQRKIKDFDLIIFDNYIHYGLMQPAYFKNIASFVKEGGAFLLAMGSDQPDQTLFKTALGEMLPIDPKPPEQSLVKETFVPQLTDKGKIHPVTADLQSLRVNQREWASWHVMNDVVPAEGQTLMSGAGGRPLLVLDKVGEGRVAVLTSDNIWLWSKGISGGGPYTEMLRHVAHWLMKEPELEENYIKAELKGRDITVSRRGLAGDAGMTITMLPPVGDAKEIELNMQEGGWVTAHVLADHNGVYRFTSGEQKAYVVVGSGLSEEFRDVHTTAEKMRPVVEKTGGTILWYQDNPDFSLKTLDARRDSYGGRGWIGLKQNGAYTIGSVQGTALIPEGLALLLLLGGLLWCWRREGSNGA